jgi:hypothetical protein
LCGYILAIAVGAPLAYMLSIEPVLQEISRVYSIKDHVSVEVPSSTTIARLAQDHKDYIPNEGAANPPRETESSISAAQPHHLLGPISPKPERQDIEARSASNAMSSDNQHSPPNRAIETSLPVAQIAPRKQGPPSQESKGGGTELPQETEKKLETVLQPLERGGVEMSQSRRAAFSSLRMGGEKGQNPAVRSFS